MPKVLILGGSGKIGSHSAAAFTRAGWTVSSYTRGSDMTAAARGADVIVNGLNPQGYHDWARQVPAITAQVLAAARASGATVILPGNVYVFGDSTGPDNCWDETSPHRPSSRKGRIRVEMEAAYRASGVRTIVLRAGDFIDPARNGDVLSLVYLRNLGRGRFTFPGDPDALHAFAYLPDWARAAVALAERRADLPAFVDIPFPGHALTARDMKARVEAVLGRSLRADRMPWGLMRIASPVWELAREVREMRYLWSLPHRLSGRRLAEVLPDFVATDLDAALRAALPQQVDPHQTVRSGERDRAVT